VLLRIIIKILYLSDLCSEMEGRHYENDAFTKETGSLFEDCLKVRKGVYRCRKPLLVSDLICPKPFENIPPTALAENSDFDLGSVSLCFKTAQQVLITLEDAQRSLYDVQQWANSRAHDAPG
jgi:hypothetical protein